MKALKLIGRWLSVERSPLGAGVGLVYGALVILATPPMMAFGRWWLSVWGL